MCEQCCGQKEHLADKRPKPKVDRKDQPCFGCGKTGHQSRDCPERKKRADQRRGRIKAIENGPAPAVRPTTGRVLCIDMPPIPTPPTVNSDGFEAPRCPRRANLGSFIVAAKPKKEKSGVRFMRLSEADACRLGGNCGHSGCVGDLETVNAEVDVDGNSTVF